MSETDVKGEKSEYSPEGHASHLSSLEGPKPTGIPQELLTDLAYQKAVISERYADVSLQLKYLRQQEKLLADALMTVNDQLNLRNAPSSQVSVLAGIPLRRAKS